jgi:hypothetical protein
LSPELALIQNPREYGGSGGGGQVGGFAVTPAALERGGTRLVSHALQLERLADRLDPALARSAGSLAGLATADAIGACRTRWGRSLDSLAASVAELGGRVLASGGRYAGDDDAVARLAVTIVAGAVTGGAPPASAPAPVGGDGEWTPGPPGARWG